MLKEIYMIFESQSLSQKRIHNVYLKKQIVLKFQTYTDFSPVIRKLVMRSTILIIL